MTQAWVYLIFAGLSEILFAIGIKYTEGFSKPVPTIFTVLAMLLSLFLLSRASIYLPIGTTYTVWVGIGAIGAAIAGMILFQEPASLLRFFFLGLLLISIVGIKLTSS